MERLTPSAAALSSKVGQNSKLGGRTQIDGTVYEISFSKPLTITISGGSSGEAYVQYNGANTTNGIITINSGESVKVRLYSSNGRTCNIYLNSTYVTGGAQITYEYTPSANATIKFTSRYASGWIYDAYITEG